MDIWEDLGIVLKIKIFGTRMSEFKSQLNHLLVMVLSQVTGFFVSQFPYPKIRIIVLTL